MGQSQCRTGSLSLLLLLNEGQGSHSEGSRRLTQRPWGLHAFMICILARTAGLVPIRVYQRETLNLLSSHRFKTSVRMEGSRRERRGSREPEDESAKEDRGPRLPGGKRTVAMHVGYIGTAFKGLQASRELPVDDTIECVLVSCHFSSRHQRLILTPLQLYHRRGR